MREERDGIQDMGPASLAATLNAAKNRFARGSRFCFWAFIRDQFFSSQLFCFCGSRHFRRARERREKWKRRERLMKDRTDIRAMLRTQLNLQILLDRFLTPVDKIMFSYQHARALPVTTSGDEDQSPVARQGPPIEFDLDAVFRNFASPRNEDFQVCLEHRRFAQSLLDGVVGDPEEGDQHIHGYPPM